MQLLDLAAARGYDRIYLAPHPDDAALSCGGAIAARQLRGDRQLVVTLCSAIPPGAELQWQQRLDEDARALNVLGVDGLRGGFLDAPFRHRAYRAEGGLFAPPVSDDPMLGHLTQFLAALARQNGEASLYAPLAVGSHVDHVIAFAAARVVTQFAEVHYFEDFPYTAKDPNALDERLRALGNEPTAQVHDIGHHFQKKTEAVQQYSSQVDLLFGSADAAVHALVEEARRVLPMGMGERTWTLVSDPYTSTQLRTSR